MREADATEKKFAAQRIPWDPIVVKTAQRSALRLVQRYVELNTREVEALLAGAGGGELGPKEQERGYKLVFQGAQMLMRGQSLVGGLDAEAEAAMTGLLAYRGSFQPPEGMQLPSL